MTAFTWRAEANRVVIASDTLGYTITSSPMPLGFISKVVPFPHLRAALYGRGVMAVLWTAAAHLALRADVTDVDSAVEALPDILRAVTDEYAAANDIDNHRELLLFEGYLAGYSDSRRRFVVARFTSTDDYEPLWGENEMGSLRAVPTLPDAYVPREAAGKPVETQLVAIMTAMRSFFADHPEVVPAVIGGEVQLTEVTRQGVTSRIVHRFSDFEQTRIAATAVAGRVARGDLDIDIAADMARLDEALSEPEIRALQRPNDLPAQQRLR